jgi:hypothetical protein
MSPSRQVPFVAAAFLCGLWSGCAGRKSESPQQPEVCRIYLECASSAMPGDAGELLEIYGSQGSCWTGTAEEAALCEDDCNERLDDLREQFPDDASCTQEPDTTDDDDGPTEDDGGGSIQLIVTKDVDVLFVIDNSGSMGAAQASLSAGFPAFLDVLEAEDVGANYRIGVTTTDNGNPYCETTGPEAGKLQMSSCRSRQSEFVFPNPPTDVTAIACTDLCDIDDLDIQPTTTDLDPEPRPRPWLENIEGKTNLPDADGDGTPDYTTVQAFQCFGPQGLAGCGFEAHLESMYKALLRSEKEDEPQYGFVRSNAILSVVIVTDEVDCSYNSDYGSIFLPADMGGNEVFWEPEPTGVTPTGFPSSAVCWNAGVACTGGPGAYDECHAENYDLDGNVGAADDAAVLHPLSRYIGFMEDLEDQKRDFTPNAEVLVALIAGVPAGYETEQAELVYADATGQEQHDFGIGAGCVNGELHARPPVRERELAEAFEVGGQRNVYSICANDFAPALDSIADSIRDQLRPTCMPACVADTNPVTGDVVDPSCSLIQQSPRPEGGIDELDIPECDDGALPDGADVCYVAVVGDDMHPQCSDEGWNLEFRLVRRQGVPAPAGTSVGATCQLSTNKAVDCPGLPG